jgi:hypothetical protein
MSKRRSVRRIAGLLLGVALAVSACGVPTHSKPVVDRNLSSGIGTSGGGAPPAPNPDAGYRDAESFVVNGYMTAVVSQVSVKAQALAVQAFMAKGSPAPIRQDSAKSLPLPVTVVREINATSSTTGGITTVKLDVAVVGVFDPVSGSLTPQGGDAPSTRELAFSVVSAGTGSFRLTSAPPDLYMFASSLAEESNYAPQPIYFWTTTGHLVPDLRYLATWLSPQQEATSIVTWILSGAPAWMGPMKTVVPTGVGLRDPTITVESNGAFVINLTPTALTSDQVADFLVQVHWSLGTVHFDKVYDGSVVTQPIELEIANRIVVKNDGSDAYVSRNQAALRDLSPTAYAIVSGKAQAVGYVSPASSDINPLPRPNGAIDPTKASFESADNANVVYGAVHVTPDQQVDVALVRTSGSRQELWVARTDHGDAVKFTKVKVPDQMKPVTFGRPVWLTQTPGSLAIVANGKLFVLTKKNTLQQVATNVDDITAFSIAPDGYRIAYVSAGQVWTALLSASPDPSMTPATALNLKPRLDRAESVAWESTAQLLVAGTQAGQGYAIETNSDGVDAADPRLYVPGYTDPATPQIVSYPATPLLARAFSPVMLQDADGAVWGRAQLNKLVSGKDTAANNPFFAE